jgi:hypothetical protein
MWWRTYWTYWPMALIGLVAAVLLIVGTSSGEALAAAGFTFAGVAVARFLDLANEQHRKRTEDRAARRRDLDETRRLAYAALARSRTFLDIDGAMLAGTLVNALVHHGVGVDAEEAVETVPRIVSGTQPNETAAWLRDKIDLLTYALDSLEHTPAG